MDSTALAQISSQSVSPIPVKLKFLGKPQLSHSQHFYHLSHHPPGLRFGVVYIVRPYSCKTLRSMKLWMRMDYKFIPLIFDRNHDDFRQVCQKADLCHLCG